ncbi:MAG: right-handed parallel beta-helix repeat-containing protein [Bacillota bacterium]|nr:right-handed parallel beta-helix repeat-containing protein [Bacillota bacterium]
MPYGFQRILDFSQLSLKNLNDQLELLWRKAMGGIEWQDFSQGLQGSLALGADNLIQNGNGHFGTENWQTSGLTLSAFRNTSAGRTEFSAQGTGNLSQYGIAIQPSKKYTVSFVAKIQAAGSWSCTVFGQREGSSETAEDFQNASIPISGSGYAEYSACFTANGEQTHAFIRFTGSGGTIYLTDIQLKAGEVAAEFSQNPDEGFAEGLVQSGKLVRLSTSNLYLEQTDAAGDSSALIADCGAGVGLLNAGDIYLEGKRCLQRTGITLYVSTTGNDSQDGLTSQTAFRTLQRAVDMIPHCIHDTCTINLAAGTYIEKVYVRMPSHYCINLYGNSATLKGALRILGGTSVFNIYDLNISSNLNIGLWIRGAGLFVLMSGGSINGNQISGGHGAYVEAGANLGLESVKICNCPGSAIYAMYCARVNEVSCTGSSNGIGMYANAGGIITGYSTAPSGTTPRLEANGGKILSYGTPTSATPPSTETPATETTWNPTGTGCMRNGAWRTDSQNVRQGQWPITSKAGQGSISMDTAINKGFWFFDYADIQSKLAGKTIESIFMTIKRDNGGVPTAVPAHLWLHDAAGPSGTPNLVSDLSTLTKLGWQQETTVCLPLAAGDALKNGSAKGIALYHESSDKGYYLNMAPSSKFTTKLTIAYR